VDLVYDGGIALQLLHIPVSYSSQVFIKASLKTAGIAFLMNRMFKQSAHKVPIQRMKITFPDKSDRVVDITPMKVDQLLSDLGMNPLEVLVSRNGTLVTEDAIVENGDEIRIIRIAHGG
jgi:sulfur carrier protein